MDEKRLRKFAGLKEQVLQEQSGADIAKAGKVLGQVEQLVSKELKKFDKGESQLKKQYLRAAMGALVWSLIETRVEQWSGEDIDIVAEEVGMTVAEFAKANPKTIVKLIFGEAQDETVEKTGDDEIDEVLQIDHGDIDAHINGLKF